MCQLGSLLSFAAVAPNVRSGPEVPVRQVKPKVPERLETAFDRIPLRRPSRAARYLAECSKRLEASITAGDDRVWIGVLDEGPCFGLVVLSDKTIDRGLEVGDGVKDAVLQSTARELGKEARKTSSSLIPIHWPVLLML